MDTSSTMALSEIRFADNKVIEVNYQFLELTGFSKEELIYKDLSEINELLRYDINLMIINDVKINEGFIFTKDLLPRHVNIVSSGSADSEIILQLHRLYDDELELRLPFVEQLIRGNNQAIAVYNASDFKLLRTNQKYCDIFYKYPNGYKDNLGHSLSESSPNWFNSSTSLIWRDVIEKNEQYYENERYHEKANGDLIYYSYNLIPIAEDGIVKYVVVMCEDKTENTLIKKYMDQKNDLEKILETQEQFFSYITHEFKTPLTVTYSALQLLDYFCSGELSDRAKRFVNKIRQSTLQQLRLVNNLLDITKADSGYLKLNKRNYDIVFMTEAIVNSVLLIGKEKGIGIIFSSTLSSKFVLMDDEKYERILLNILSNAIKFTPSGKNVNIDLYIKNNFVNVTVRDEGAGIPKDKQEMIFDRFGQVNNGLTKNGEGTGIGLCLAKMLAKALGGDITLKSELEVGSEFTILIPDVCASNSATEMNFRDQIEDRLIQSVNVEFSTIYQ